LWAAAERNGLPISFHVATGLPRSSDGTPISLASSDLTVSLPGSAREQFGARGAIRIRAFESIQAVLASIVCSGVLDDHPNLHVISAENNGYWLASLMAGLDKAFSLGVGQEDDYRVGNWDTSASLEQQHHLVNVFEYNRQWNLPLKPSEYIRRQVHVTFMDDPVAVELRAMTGIDPLLWAADYPHAEGTFPRSREALAAQMSGVSTAERRAITGGTLARLYSIKLPGADRPHV
jgi:predicted TIM-barrel fold metal-dependent hydrolase